eukprot:gene1873-1905_t
MDLCQRCFQPRPFGFCAGQAEAQPGWVGGETADDDPGRAEAVCDEAGVFGLVEAEQVGAADQREAVCTGEAV